MSGLSKTIFRHQYFLKDVFVFACTAFGGPQAHISLMQDQFVKRKHYVTDAELMELNALCNLLPGPTSTQTITAIGFKLGGPWLAFCTLIIWIAPAVTLMSLLALCFNWIASQHISLSFLRFVEPIAVGFVAAAAYRLIKQLVKAQYQWLMLFSSITLVMLVRSPWIYPIVLILSALFSNWIHRKDIQEGNKERLKVSWANFYLFVGILILLAIAGNITQLRPILLLENIYRYASLVFGGGHVLIPMMYDQWVTLKDYLTSDEFLTGYGIAQAIPGPVFAFGSYATGLSMKSWGPAGIALGSFLGTIGVFLPGALLIFFIYPAWKQIREKKYIQRSIDGLNITATGLVTAAVLLLLEPIGYTTTNLWVVIFTAGLVQAFGVKPFFVILLGVLAGVVLPTSI